MNKTGEKRPEALKPKHSLLLENRQRMVLSGVTEVCGFSDSSVSLKTECGALVIRGKGLTISRLDTDTGELNVSGEIYSMQYSKCAGKKRPLLEGLFR